MKYIIVATQLCLCKPNEPNLNDIRQKTFYLKGYDVESKRLMFDARAKFALKLDSYFEAVDILNFQRNCDIQRLYNKNNPTSNIYYNIVEYLKELDAKMKYEIICVYD